MRTGRIQLISTAVFAVALLAAAAAPTPTNWQIGPFTRPLDTPVITPNKASLFNDPIAKTPVHWESLHTFNPAAIVRDGKIVVLYRAEDDTGKMQIGEHTSRLGLASSSDGITFTRLPEPVFFPAEDAQKSREWPGGVEDPRIVESADGPANQRYVITYTQWNRETYSIGLATSPDLEHWTKHGPIFLGAAKANTIRSNTNREASSPNLKATASSPQGLTVSTGCSGARSSFASPPPPTSSIGPPSKTHKGIPSKSSASAPDTLTAASQK